MSTSKLQRRTGARLRKLFGKYGLVENRRPPWLVSSKGERLELDFFIDKLSVAVEVQGRQHFEFTPRFHATEYDFREQLRRDREKRQICTGSGISLLYIKSSSDIDYISAHIFAMASEQLDAYRDDREDDVSTYRISRPQRERIKGIRQIENTIRGYKRCKKKGKDFSETGFKIHCAGIERLLAFEELLDDEWPILAEAIWIKKEIADNY